MNTRAAVLEAEAGRQGDADIVDMTTLSGIGLINVSIQNVHTVCLGIQFEMKRK